MNHPDSPVTGEGLGPSGVDPTLFGARVLTGEAVGEMLREFWHDDPTESWQPYIDATNEAIDSGVPVVILSGRFGTGKTQMFGGQLERSRSDYLVLGEGGDLVADDLLGLKERVIHYDEATIDVRIGVSRLAYSIKAGIAGGKQFVMVLPGITADTRLRDVRSLTDQLHQRGINTLNLGDVSETHLEPARVERLLTSLGVGQPAIELIKQVPALRSSRLFSCLISQAQMDSYLHDSGTIDFASVLTPDYICNQIVGLADRTQRDQTSSSYRELHTQPFNHIPFLTPSLSTGDAIKLYEAFDIPLPQPSDFPANLGFDPYDKN